MTTDTDLTAPPLTASEAERRLPSLACIDDREIRPETLRLSQFAPSYFWERPGSTRGYHNGFTHGLWAHTLRLSTILDRLADSWVEQGHISGTDVDAAHAAAILHDQRKEGADGGQTASDHDIIMARVVREESALPGAVGDAIAAHMGAWYDGPAPTPGSIEDLVHTADMLASCSAISVPVPAPCPRELADDVEGVRL
jgi:hypothetical protein